MRCYGLSERSSCFAYIVFLVSRDGCVALPRGAMGLFVILVFPDHTHLLFTINSLYTGNPLTSTFITEDLDLHCL